MEDSSRKEHPVASLTDDLLPEILSRVPYKSLCRLKSVSKSWLAVCSDPIVRKKTPQTHHFTNLSGRGQRMVDPSLNFLFSADYVEVEFVHCCNGLLLCSCEESSDGEFDRVVCNPATEKWTVLPKTEARLGRSTMYLGFDPTVSSHFTVFLLSEFTRGMQDNEVAEEDEIHNWYHQIRAVEIYSSQTGRWTYH